MAAGSARELLSGPDRPTAVFAANDITAIATIETAVGLGLQVPDDLSVVGFDNIPESALCAPPLTTVEQPIREMGHRAITLLVRLINGETPDETHVTLGTELIVRRSTRAVQS
ncbi:substrate-binding domain-containing protein [Lentzea indica]|uniref:substrate-binding domain-containing protein n=1 Tax=Lentzea indica TaxID=2604800 RepID=UPI0028B0658F|nr:substrate-binding domain-containing protein [Lentzea indica]